MSDYLNQVAAVRRLGWSKYLCTEEDKQGREVRMPQWVMGHVCRHVDANTAAAARAEDGGGFRIVDAYLSEPLDDEIYSEWGGAMAAADEWNDRLGIGPLVLPRNFAIIGGCEQS